MFAIEIPGANIEALQEVVLDCGKSVEAYIFAKMIQDSDGNALLAVAEKDNFAGLQAKQIDAFRAIAMVAKSSDEQCSSMGM